MNVLTFLERTIAVAYGDGEEKCMTKTTESGQ